MLQGRVVNLTGKAQRGLIRARSKLLLHYICSYESLNSDNNSSYIGPFWNALLSQNPKKIL